MYGVRTNHLFEVKLRIDKTYDVKGDTIQRELKHAKAQGQVGILFGYPKLDHDSSSEGSPTTITSPVTLNPKAVFPLTRKHKIGKSNSPNLRKREGENKGRTSPNQRKEERGKTIRTPPNLMKGEGGHEKNLTQ